MAAALSLRFLGTGPSGGRPGRGRSRRRESSLLVSSADGEILVDVTRDFAAQAHALRAPDLVLLTHSHRDAAGGLPGLQRWLRARGAPAIEVLAAPETVRALRRRHPRLDRVIWRPAPGGRSRRFGGTRISSLVVPHSPGCVTCAWKLRCGAASLVYASDVARLTPALRRFCRGAQLLVVDGAMFGRGAFTHLTIQDALPRLARWDVGRLLFTQLGRSTPAHEALDAWLRGRCARAGAAYDGMRVRLGS